MWVRVMRKYRCTCPHCNHEWTYIPRHPVPSRRPTCPRCKKSVDFLNHCKPV